MGDQKPMVQSRSRHRRVGLEVPWLARGTELVRENNVKSQRDVLVVSATSNMTTWVTSKVTGRSEHWTPERAARMAAALQEERSQRTKKIASRKKMKIENTSVRRKGRRRERKREDVRDKRQKTSTDTRHLLAKRTKAVRADGTVDEVLLRPELRRKGDAARQLLRQRERESPAWKTLDNKISDFYIPGGHWSVRLKGTSIAVYFEMMEEMLTSDYRAPPTWVRLHGPWMQAKKFIKEKMELDGKVFCTKDLQDHQEYITAAAKHRFDINESISAVTSCLSACNMAMKVNNINRTESFYDNMLREICRRQRTKMAKKSMGITLAEAKTFQAWDETCPHDEHQMGVFVQMGFERTLRWSDAMVMLESGIFWMGAEGAVIAIAKRKNAQTEVTYVAYPDTGTATCSVHRLRGMLERHGSKPPKFGWGREERFVFKEWTSARSRSHKGHRKTSLGEGHFRCGKQAYPKWKRVFQRGMRENAGKTTD